MATLKVVLDTRRLKTDGTYPIKIRITHRSQPREIPLNASVLLEDWDEGKQRVRSSYPNAKTLNLRIKQKLIEVEKVILDLELEGKRLTANLIKDVLTKPEGDTQSTFLEFAYEQIDLLQQSGKVGNARTYKLSVLKLEKYLNGKDIPFEEMTYAFLQKFQASMFSEGLKVNTVSVYLRTIRAIYNRAIKST